MRPLTRRTQIELLASACQTHEPVRLELHGTEPAQPQSQSQAQSQAEGHLLACDRRSVLVELACSQPATGDATTSRVNARFGHRGRRFSFSTTVLGSISLPAANRERTGVRLAMPLVLRERAARTAERIRPADTAPLCAELLVIGPEKARVKCRIVDVSVGGVGCELATVDATRLAGQVLIRLRPEGQNVPRECDFIVRLVHSDAISEQDSRIGLAFVGLDDAAELDGRLRRLQDWITGASRAETRGFETRDEGDRGPC